MVEISWTKQAVQDIDNIAVFIAKILSIMQKFRFSVFLKAQRFWNNSQSLARLFQKNKTH
jgi:hypothetical protein